MQRETIITFRTSEALKAKLKEEANRRKTTVSELINGDLTARYLSKDKQVEPPSEAAWAAFRNYVGGDDLGGRTPSPEEIDRIVCRIPNEGERCPSLSDSS